MSTLPQSSIVVQTISTKRRGILPFPLKNLRRYVSLLTQQAVIGASVIIKHPFVSPPHPSWPLHLTLFVSVIRATANIQEYVADDVSDIRRAVDLFFYYLPKLPQMHIVPFNIPIPAQGRSFPGVLEQLEQSEDGRRTLPGQWIADTQVWDRVMKLPLANTTKNSKDPYAAREGEKIILYIHGGGYFICSTATHRELLWRISRATGRRVFAVDYRLAPEHPYPAPLQDAAHAFCQLTDPNGYGFDPENITIGGDSAGGGLTIALMMYQRDHGMSMPSKALLLSPWLDLTMSCQSWLTNSKDYLPAPPRIEQKFNPIAFYCSGRDKVKTLARHPYISPLWGNLTGLPPMLLQCGEAERLRDECILFTHKAGGSFGSCNKLPFQDTTEPRHQSDHVELDMYPGMVHVFQAIPFLAESSMALQRMREFIERKEAGKQAETVAEVEPSATAKSEQVEQVHTGQAEDSQVQADEMQVIMEQWMEEVVESTAIRHVESLQLRLQPGLDDMLVERETVTCQA